MESREIKNLVSNKHLYVSVTGNSPKLLGVIKCTQKVDFLSYLHFLQFQLINEIIAASNKQQQYWLKYH